jgi:hypothetical protein
LNASAAKGALLVGRALEHLDALDGHDRCRRDVERRRQEVDDGVEHGLARPCS